VTTTDDVIKAAAFVARDTAEGRLSPLDLQEQAVAECRALFGAVAGPGRISLHAGRVPADQLDGFIQSFLPPTRDENVSSFVNEQLGTGQRHTT
jgi:hypothetical protein